MTIERSDRKVVLTDPQRRVYNGCAFSSELVWTEFRIIESRIPEEKIDERLDFWVELNDYAVSERGEGSRSRFRTVQDKD